MTATSQGYPPSIGDTNIGDGTLKQVKFTTVALFVLFMVMQFYGHQDAVGVCTPMYPNYPTSSVETVTKESEYDYLWKWFTPNYDTEYDMWFISEMPIMVMKYIFGCGSIYYFYCHFAKQERLKLFKKVNFMKIILFWILVIMQICTASDNNLDTNNTDTAESPNLKRKADVAVEKRVPVTNKKPKLDETHEITITNVKLNQNDTDDNAKLSLLKRKTEVESSIESFMNISKKTKFDDNSETEIYMQPYYPPPSSYNPNYAYLNSHNDPHRHEQENINDYQTNKNMVESFGFERFYTQPYYTPPPNYFNPNYRNGYQRLSSPYNFYNKQKKKVEKIDLDIVNMGELKFESAKDKFSKRKDNTDEITESELHDNFHQHIQNMGRYIYNEFNPELYYRGSTHYAVLETDALILKEYYKVYYGHAVKYLCKHKKRPQNLQDHIVKIIVNYLTGPKPQSNIIISRSGPNSQNAESYELSNLVKSSFKYRNLLLTKAQDPALGLERILFYPVSRLFPPDQNDERSMLQYYFEADHYYLDLYHTYAIHLHVGNKDGQKFKVILPAATQLMWVQYPELVECIFPYKHNNYDDSNDVINIDSTYTNSHEYGLYIFTKRSISIEISQVYLGGLYFPRSTEVDSKCIKMNRCPYVNWARINLPSNVNQLDLNCCDTEVLSTIDKMTQKNKDQVESLKLFNVNIESLDLTSFRNLKTLLINGIMSNIEDMNWNNIKLPANTIVEFELHEYVEFSKKFAHSSFFKSLTHLRLREVPNIPVKPINYPPELQSLILDLDGHNTINWATSFLDKKDPKIERIEIHTKYATKTKELLTCDLRSLQYLKHFSVELSTGLDEKTMANYEEKVKTELFAEHNLEINNNVEKELLFLPLSQYLPRFANLNYNSARILCSNN